MSIDKILDGVTPDIYGRMQNAIATGRWPNGVLLSEDQRANCLQIIIAHDAKHKDTEERVGYLPTKPIGSRRPGDLERRSELESLAETQPIRILVED